MTIVGSPLAECVLSRVADVQKSVRVLVLFIDLSEVSTALRKNFPDKEEYCFFRRQLDPLTYDPHKLSYRYIRWNKEFSFVDLLNIASRSLFHNDGNSIGILRTYLLAFLLPLNERMKFLEFPLHSPREEVLQQHRMSIEEALSAHQVVRNVLSKHGNQAERNN